VKERLDKTSQFRTGAASYSREDEGVFRIIFIFSIKGRCKRSGTKRRIVRIFSRPILTETFNLYSFYYLNYWM